MTAPGRLAVIVPTTGAALRLLALVPRPGLPHGAAFAEGDYRQLSLSPDYRALSGPEGPIVRQLGRSIPPHELRLSGAPDSGRSWEAPVALAHLMLARGWTLTPEPEDADLTLWATGAVDLDLTLLPGDYAPERKVALSLELLGKARSSLAVLPPGPGRETAEAALKAAGFAALCPTTLAEVLETLTPGPTRTHRAPAAPTAARSSASLHPALLALAVIAVAAAGIFAANGAFDPWLEPGPTTIAETEDVDQPVPDDPQDGPLPVGPDGVATTDQVPEVTPEADETVTSGTEPADPTDTLTNDPAPVAPAITISEIHAAEGGSCRSALFNPAQRTLKPLGWTPDGFPPSVLSPSFCGIALSTLDGSLPAIPTATPPDAFLPVDAPAGSLHLFLRAGLQNVVYTVPDPRDGANPPISHQIKAPN